MKVTMNEQIDCKWVKSFVLSILLSVHQRTPHDDSCVYIYFAKEKKMRYDIENINHMIQKKIIEFVEK